MNTFANMLYMRHTRKTLTTVFLNHFGTKESHPHTTLCTVQFYNAESLKQIKHFQICQNMKSQSITSTLWWMNKNRVETIILGIRISMKCITNLRSALRVVKITFLVWFCTKMISKNHNTTKHADCDLLCVPMFSCQPSLFFSSYLRSRASLSSACFSLQQQQM